MKQLLILSFTILLTLFSSNQLAAGTLSQANTSNLSEASGEASAGLALVGSGAVVTLIGSGRVVIESIKTVGQSTEVVLKSIATLSTASLQFASGAIDTSRFIAGQSLQLLAHNSGTLLIRAGEIIAFIPNQLGQSLLYQAQQP